MMFLLLAYCSCHDLWIGSLIVWIGFSNDIVSRWQKEHYDDFTLREVPIEGFKYGLLTGYIMNWELSFDLVVTYSNVSN